MFSEEGEVKVASEEVGEGHLVERRTVIHVCGLGDEVSQVTEVLAGVTTGNEILSLLSATHLKREGSCVVELKFIGARCTVSLLHQVAPVHLGIGPHLSSEGVHAVVVPLPTSLAHVVG